MTSLFLLSNSLKTNRSSLNHLPNLRLNQFTFSPKNNVKNSFSFNQNRFSNLTIASSHEFPSSQHSSCLFHSFPLSSSSKKNNVRFGASMRKGVMMNQRVRPSLSCTETIADSWIPEMPAGTPPFYRSLSTIKLVIKNLLRRMQVGASLRKAKGELLAKHKEKFDPKAVIRSFPETYKKYNELVLANDLNGLRQFCSNTFAHESLNRVGNLLKGKKVERRYGSLYFSLANAKYFELPSGNYSFLQMTFKVKSTQAIDVTSKGETLKGELVPITEYIVAERNLKNSDPSKWTLVGIIDPKKLPSE